MKILLTTLNSKYIHSNLAVKYIYSAVMNEKIDLDLKEYTINNDKSYVFGEIVRGDYDAVAFSCYIWNIEETMYLAENLKKSKPEIQIIMGGPEVATDAAAILIENKFVDFIIQGEGEYAFTELCKCFNQIIKGETTPDKCFPKIDGLVYRFKGKIYVNKSPNNLVMDSIPNPYQYIAPEEDKIIYYESSRGCPRKCSYCLSSIEKSVRAISMERVKADLSYFIIKGVRQVKFIDRTFNYDKTRAYEILKYLIEKDNGITNFHFEICADLVDQKLIELLGIARKGLFQFEIGVQSTNRDALNAVKRSTDVRLVLENINKLVNLGNIEVHSDLIAGLPFESYSSFRTSFNNVYRTGTHKLHLGFLKLLKGTEIRTQEAIYGYVYQRKAPYEIISNKFITAKELVKLHQIESVFDYYYNRGGFKHTLEFATEMAGGAFEFFEALAEYYYFKGYQHSSHSKEDMYRIMYQYSCTMNKSIENYSENMKACLVKDMEETLNPEAIKKFQKKGFEI